MRIAVDASRTVVAQRTGTERYSLELLRSLLRLDQENEYSLYFNQAPASDLIPSGPNWQPRVTPLPRLWTHLRLSRELARDRPDLLFVPAHVLPLRHPTLSVVTIHDLGFRFFPRSHPLVSRLYLELSTLWAARRATRLIAVSESTRRDLQRLYGLAADRVRVVYEGVSSHFQPVRDPEILAATLQHYGLESAPYFLALGTIQPRKNLPALLRAFRGLLDSLREPDPGYLLALVGRSVGGQDMLAADIERLGLRQKVYRLGYVPDGDLPALYSGALAYVQPSLYEGFGLTVLEALACGAPVVASNTSALPEVVGSAGLLVDPNSPAEMADALRRLVREPVLRTQLADLGQRRAAEFTWERCARDTLRVLLEAGKHIT